MKRTITHTLYNTSNKKAAEADANDLSRISVFADRSVDLPSLRAAKVSLLKTSAEAVERYGEFAVTWTIQVDGKKTDVEAFEKLLAQRVAGL